MRVLTHARQYDAGVTEGFQWRDGSFTEDVERREQRPPNDIDIVTFVQLPPGMTESDLDQRAPTLFAISSTGEDLAKATYRVDGYFVFLAGEFPAVIQQSTYWYSMWSHRRDGV